ncbi:hypothetical protein [Paenibacillus alkalitolerans]|nr:hypothetical protein [Paenibacillus alkalitolerans]
MYERFFFGDTARVAGRLYNAYSKREHYIDKVKKFISINLDLHERSK